MSRGGEGYCIRQYTAPWFTLTSDMINYSNPEKDALLTVQNIL